MRTEKLKILLIAGLGLGLTACAQSQMRLSPDFGDAVNSDTVAQIADPDAHYAGIPAPGASGDRVDLAQTRYGKDQVIQPTSITASSAASIGNAQNSGSGGAGMSMGATSP
jgi:hypothetical protein